MEKEQETSRKKMVKRVAAIFLAAMLILTFFSNTIMNYSLPEVATEPVKSGTVSNKVRGQGTVETNSEYEVTVSGARVIKEIKVDEGDEVKEGEVLFVFEEGENSELTQAQNDLDQMELDYAKSLLKVGPDYYSNNQEITVAKEELKDAVEAQKTAAVNEKELADAKKDLQNAKKKVADLTKQIEAAGGNGDYTEVSENVKTLEKNLADEKSRLSDLQDELKQAENGEIEISAEEIKREIREKEKVIADLETEIKTQKALLDSLKKASVSMAKLQKDLAYYQEQVETLTARIAELEAAPTVSDAKKAVKEKQRALDNARHSLQSKKEEDSVTQQIENMDQKAAQDKIEQQRKKVEQLEKSDDIKQIKAKEDGIVSQIGCKVGDTVGTEAPLAKIQLAKSGYIVNITIPKEKSELIKVGDEATVENVWDNGVSAAVKSMKADPENPNRNMIVVFDVTGDVEPGQTLAFAVGEKSNRYDTIVPNSAIKEDSNGKFVLVVTQKGTPLGNRYKIKRADVDVQASDDTASGVSGGVYEYEDVVTNSTKPLEEGMQVRLAK